MSDDSEEEFLFDDEPKAPPKEASVKKEAPDDDRDFAPSPAPRKKRKKTVLDNDDDSDDQLASLKKKKKKRRKSSDAKADPDKPSKKKIKKEPAAVKKEKNGAPGTPSKAAKQRELKKLDKTERLQFAMQSFLWWDAPEPPEGCQWVTMEHAGVCFPDTYTPHGVRMLYDGKPVDLTPEQEEAATFFAAIPEGNQQLGNPKTATIFTKNYFEDFRKVLGKGHIIKDFKKCDFEPIRRYLNEQKIVKKAITDEERKANKEARNKIMYQYGYAIVDGHVEKVGNYNMEPPGTFLGRGAHPKMGKLKQRVTSEQVSLNVSECAPVPRCPVPGHAWGDVRHDPRGQWLATWKENINNQSKYVQLAAQSSFKGKSDRNKYSKAALLCKHIDGIRKSYKKDLRSSDKEIKQLATATWVIDQLALRVGGEKDTDEEADTVGCCSLRVEHLHFDPNREGGDNREIELEFLGKDSMLYKQTIDFGSERYNAGNGWGSQIYDNLKSFCKGKEVGQDVFDMIDPTRLNQHLKKFMDGLSAKVFRTYNASKTLQEELRKHEANLRWQSLPVAEKVVEYNNANREVAILCNHQRSVSKAQETQLENISGKLQTLKKQKKELKAILKKLSSGNTDGIRTKKSIKDREEKAKADLEKAKRMKEKAKGKSNEEKIKATEFEEGAKQRRRDLIDKKFQEAHLWEKIPSTDQVAKKITNWNSKIAKMELDLKHRDDNKEVSLGTSKINYMDPRISVAFCKRNEVPIEKIFSKTLRDKFNWAMAVTPEWEFNASIAKF